MRTRTARAYLALLALLFVVGCTATDDSSAEEGSTDTTFAWSEIELTDVETGETFTFSELAGQQVFVQAFAVW